MKILVFGGDKRQIYAAEYLAECSHDVTLAGFDNVDNLNNTVSYKSFDKAENYDAVLLGLPSFVGDCKVNCPMSKTEYSLTDIVSRGMKCRVFCAMPSKYEKELFLEMGIDYTDYYTLEKLQTLNSIPTAEGAINVFFKNSDITVFGSKCFVIGYGRIGKALAKRLSALGADVCVYARSERSLAEALTDKARILTIGKDSIDASEFDCIFNTVPCVIFNKSFASKAVNTLYIELASSPGSLDKDTIELLGKNYIKAPSLPGRFAPKSAGEIIGECINARLE